VIFRSSKPGNVLINEGLTDLLINFAEVTGGSWSLMQLVKVIEPQINTAAAVF
jgi:hypothetical protein